MNLKRFTRIAMIAAIYTAVSMIPGLSSLVFGPIQIRFAEALTVLPVIYQPAVWGVTIGCFLTNMLGAAAGLTGPVDMVIGTIATLLAAVCTWKLRSQRMKGIPVLSLLMPVLFNFFFVGFELAFMLNPGNVFQTFWIYGSEVAVGEALSVVLGYFLTRALKKTGIFNE